MFDILEQSTSIDAETVLQCGVNNTGLTDEVLLRHFCPFQENSTNNSYGIKVIFSKLMKDTEPQFVLKGLLNFIWMEQKLHDHFLQNPSNISLLPVDTARLMTRSLFTLTEEEQASLLNVREWKPLFHGCGVHTNLLTCTDTIRDFCIHIKAELGLTILSTIFLPGLVQGLGNLLFHQRGFLPLGFEKEVQLSLALRMVVPLPYLIYMMVVAPIDFITYNLFIKYIEEKRSGVVVQDNGGSVKDDDFFRFQIKKSSEALSESVVQFLIQLSFLTFFIWMSQAHVSAHETSKIKK